MPKPHEFATLADHLASELSGDVPRIASSLFSTPLPDSKDVTHQRYTDVLQRAYARQDRPFLMALANADPAQFNDAYKQLGGADVPLPPEPSDEATV